VTVTGNLGVANTGQYQNAATFASSVTILGNANIQGVTTLSSTTISNAFSVGGSTLVVSGGQVKAQGQAKDPSATAFIFRVADPVYTNGIDFGVNTTSPFSGWIQAGTPGTWSPLFPLALNPSGGNVGIGTINPGAKLEVNGNVTASSVSATGASGFIGEGANITGVTVGASSSAVNNTSIASVTNIHLATATVTMRGNRPQLVLYDVDVVNGAGGSRTYTLTFSVNGTTVDTHAYTCSGGDSCHISDHHFATSTAGSRNFSIDIRSSNATGTQTVDDAKISAYEF
jgi:hypothetical protein